MTRPCFFLTSDYILNVHTHTHSFYSNWHWQEKYSVIKARCHVRLDCQALITIMHNSKRDFWYHVTGFVRKHIPCSGKKKKQANKQTTQKQISSTLEADGRTIRVAIIKLFGNKRLKKGLCYLWVNYNKRNLKPTLSSPLTQEKHIRNTKTYLRRDYSRIYYCSIIYG